jgi:hypothetical protein
MLEVDGLSLDGFIFSQDHRPPDVVKMDIGAVKCWPCSHGEGAQRSRSTAFPGVAWSESAQSTWQMLTSNGYKIVVCIPAIRLLSRSMS